MIQIYGSPRSSAGRCYLVLEEVGQPYQMMPLDMMEKREHKSAAYLKLNPNGKVPCIQDGEFVLWESMAINHYLADKYKPELLGTNAQDRALVQQWSIWSLVELQPPLVEMIIQLMFTPEPKRDMTIVARAKEKIPSLLSVLDHALAGRQYLVGSHLTLADLNAASIVNTAVGLQVPIESHKNIANWFNAISQRPSFKKLSEMRSR